MNKNSYPNTLWEINFKNNKLDSIQPFSGSKTPSSSNISISLDKDERNPIIEQKKDDFLEEMKEQFEEIKKEFSKPEEETAYLEKVLHVAHNLKSLFELIKELNNLIKRLPPSKDSPPKNPNEK